MNDTTNPILLAPPPGVIKTESPLTAKGRFIDVEKVRFVGGRAQKIGGWTQKTTSPTSGAPRTVHAWRDNTATEYIAAGTYRKVYAIDTAFALHDITPNLSTGTLGSNPIATTISSTSVVITHNAHGRTIGDTVRLSGATAVGGITISGEYVITATTTNTYTIVHSVAATSTATGGGASVAYEYEVPIGTSSGAYGLGWSVGPWGLGTWSSPRSAGVYVEPLVWSLDHFGQVLLLSYNQSALYAWSPSTSFNRAVLQTDSPTDIRHMFVTPERFVVALRANMVISWSDQGDYSVWTATSSNKANTRTVTEGTKLVGGRSLGGGVSLIRTDSALYLHQYTGSSLVFDTRLVGRNCGLISPNAAVTVGSVAYWMGQKAFFQYNGTVQKLPGIEDIRAYVFDTLTTDQGYLCAAMYNAVFNEVWFFYVVQGSSNPGRYVIYSIDQPGVWATGSLDRVAGAYFGHGDTRPYFANSAGHIFLHEDGKDDAGTAIDASATVAPIALQDGKFLMDVEALEPDFHEQAGNLTFTANAWDRIRTSSITADDSDAQTIAETDELVDLRLAGRYFGWTLRSNTLGGYFRIGEPRVFAKRVGTQR